MLQSSGGGNWLNMESRNQMMQKSSSAYEKELLKMTLLKHEEMFREQVYELHRLYRIQQLLMKDTNMIRRQRQTVIPKKMMMMSRSIINDNHYHHQIISSPILDHHQKQREVDDEDDDDQTTMIDEDEIQLTLGPSIYSKSQTLSANSSSNSSGSTQNTSNNNTTTTTNNNNNSCSPMSINGKISARKDLTWGDFIRPSENNSSSSSYTKQQQQQQQQQMMMMMMDPLSSGGVGMGMGMGMGDQEEHQIHMGQPTRPNQQQQPPWLFQALSLSLT